MLASYLCLFFNDSIMFMTEIFISSKIMKIQVRNNGQYKNLLIKNNIFQIMQ